MNGGDLDRTLNVGVVGAGTMGHGIAQACVQAGFSTVLYDVTEALARAGVDKVEQQLGRVVEKGKLPVAERDAALGRLRATGSLSALSGCGLVIEAAPEKLELKRALFSELSRTVAPTAVLASNTSSLSLTAIAQAAAVPERVIGMHFFNPVPVMKLLELVLAESTSRATVELARAFGEALGKTCIEVKDRPGFASSRLGIALGMEAIRMVEEGVASAEDVDRAMELGYGHPMGPLELTDLVGLDVRLAIAEHLERELGERFRPPALLRMMVREGKLGRKSGQGFFRY